MSIIQQIKREVLRLKSTSNGIDKLLNGAIDPMIIELKEIYKNDLGKFYEDFWPYAGTATQLIKGYAFEARVIHAQALFNRQIKFLLWAEPPKEGKSTFFNVIFPAWCWINNPEERFLTTCYAERYATRDNEYMQALITSEPFQQLFGLDFHLTRRNRIKTENNRGGDRTATCIKGQNTSAGGSMILFDDPNSIADYQKPSALEKVSDYFDNIFIHRQIDPKRTVFFVGQHRVSPYDLYGHIKAKNNPGTVSFEMPFEFDSTRRCTTYLPYNDSVFWTDTRTYDGEFINPERHSIESHNDIKSTMDPLIYSSLYQCAPLPTKGGIFERKWFKIWNSPNLPHFDFVVQSWDTAISVAATASYSACTSWGLFKNEYGIYNLLLLSIWYGRLEWNALRRMASRLAKNVFDTDEKNPITGLFPATHTIIEAKANGVSLANDLRNIGINALQYIPPPMGSKQYGKNEEGKIVRARLAQPYVESGRIFVRGEFPYEGKLDFYGEKFVNICVNFPHNIEASRDVMDTFSMTIDYLQMNKFIGTNAHFNAINKDHYADYGEMLDNFDNAFQKTDYTKEFRVDLN